MSRITLLVIIVLFIAASCTQHQKPEPKAKGLAFAGQFADLPYLKTGTQTYQNSSTDPAEDQFNDFWHWLYTDKDSNAVLADISGPGCIYRIWSTGNNGDSNHIKIYIDDMPEPAIYQTLNQFHNVPPLRQKPQVGSGGDKYLAWWSYMPIAFTRSCKIVREGNFRPFYSITYHTYTDTSGVKSWTSRDDLNPFVKMWENPVADPKPNKNHITTKMSVHIEDGNDQVVFEKTGAGSVAALKIFDYLPDKGLRIKIYWDGEILPAVDAPVKWFFGSVDNGGDLKALGIGTSGNNGYCYFPMPFWESAKIVLENRSGKSTGTMDIEVQYNPGVYEEVRCAYFHAYSHDEERPASKYTCLKITGSGHVVGMAKRMPKGGHACEGDEVFYIDNRRYPDIYGTGEEDYNNNAWWTNSYNSYPSHGCIGNDCYYRIHYPDLIVFDQAIDMEFEAWQPFYIASVVWFYKKDRPTMVMTDSLDIGSGVSEKNHQYKVEGQVWTGTRNGFFPGRRIYCDSIAETGTAFTGHSEFNVKVLPGNKGARLRLLTDNGGIQSATVWIDGTKVEERSWKISKNPFQAIWVEADFEIPEKYTKGKDLFNIKIEYNPQSQKPWSEYTYTVFSRSL